MKLLCIDYGFKRIGVATGNLDLNVARPYLVIANKGTKDSVAKLIKIIAEKQIERIIIGLPLRFNTEKGIYVEADMAQNVRKFAGALEKTLQCKAGGGTLEENTCQNEVGRGVGGKAPQIVYQNEAMSSSIAEDYIKNILGITNPDRIREIVDKHAANVILYEYMATARGE